MSRPQLQITNHAIQRWQQRIAKVTEVEAVRGILAALAFAKDKHFKPQKLRKMTFFIPAPGVVLVGSRGRIVTVLERAEDARFGLVDVDDK